MPLTLNLVRACALAMTALHHLVTLAWGVIATRAIHRSGANTGAMARSPRRQPIRVSIVLPAFNESILVVTAVQNALQQDWPEFEVIVVNDGSSDDTLSGTRRSVRPGRGSEHPQGGLVCERVLSKRRSRTFPASYRC